MNKCICQIPTPIGSYCEFHPTGITKEITYEKIIDYSYRGNEGKGGYSYKTVTVTEKSPIFLQVSEDLNTLFECNSIRGGAYTERIYECPICHRKVGKD